MAKSFQQILNMINNADNTTTGEVDWQSGLKSIVTELNLAIKDKGIIYYPTTEALSYAGGIDGGYAVIINSNGLNPYKWYPEVDALIEGAITSSAGGQWRPIFGVQAAFEGWWDYSIDGRLTPIATIIGKASIHLGGSGATDLWLDMPPVNSLGEAKGVRISPMTTSVMNSMVTPSDWMLIANTDAKMLLMQHPSIGFKSVGVYSQSISSGTVASSTISIPIPSQYVTSYKVLITALDSTTATAIANGYYISAKTSTSFTITFVSFVSGTINFDFQISH